MKKNTQLEVEVTYDTLKEAIRTYNRPLILEFLSQNVLSQIPEEEKFSVYSNLIALRDMKIVDHLSKELEHFQIEMFALDIDNRWNNEFVNQIITKYLKKFDLENDEAMNALFDFSCKIGNTKATSVILKKDPTQKRYIKLATSPIDTFDILLHTKTSTFDVDTIVDILYQAAISNKGQERLLALIDAGYDINTQNSKSKTLSDLLTARIKGNNYPSNKRGVQMKQADKNTLQSLSHLHDQKQMGKKKKKQGMIIGIAIVAILAASILFAFWYTNRDTSSDSSTSSETSSDASSTDTSASDTSSSDTSLSTDTALTVADGDTVNIDYTGYVDDVAFDNGSTNGAGADLTIGSGSYIDDFEDQLIGHNVGETVEVNVTFPDDYGTTDLAGKDARFEVTINGIYQ